MKSTTRRLFVLKMLKYIIMTSHMDRFEKAGQVKDWFTPRDPRLVELSGMAAPVDAKLLREQWHVDRSQVDSLLDIVKFLIVPSSVKRVLPQLTSNAHFNDDPFVGTIVFEFDDDSDADLCLPRTPETKIFENHRIGIIGHASIALCEGNAALAVINMPFSGEGNDILVEPIREDFADKLAAL
jgi:hypothetical protein